MYSAVLADWDGSKSNSQGHQESVVFVVVGLQRTGAHFKINVQTFYFILVTGTESDKSSILLLRLQRENGTFV
jgi:hypothetical protein